MPRKIAKSDTGSDKTEAQPVVLNERVLAGKPVFYVGEPWPTLTTVSTTIVAAAAAGQLGYATMKGDMLDFIVENGTASYRKVADQPEDLARQIFELGEGSTYEEMPEDRSIPDDQFLDCPVEVLGALANLTDSAQHIAWLLDQAGFAIVPKSDLAKMDVAVPDVLDTAADESEPVVFARARFSDEVSAATREASKASDHPRHARLHQLEAAVGDFKRRCADALGLFEEGSSEHAFLTFLANDL